MKTTGLKLSFILLFVLSFITSCTTEELEINDADNFNELESAEASNLTIGDDFLDYGIYWFNEDDESVKGFNEANNTTINVASEYYDASKPTFIYFHGWQLGSSEDNYDREGFYFEDGNVNTVKFWKDKGWNVGIFYWNQFADEIEVKDAEAKIWHAKNGPRRMRYRLSDGSYSELQSPTSNLAKLAANQINKIVGSNTSGNVRFAGHSLGSQLATNTALTISNRVENGVYPASLMPNRLELLDPFWSADPKSYLGNDWVGERSRDYIDTMIDRNNIAITWYASSLILDIGIGDSNEALKDVVAFQSVRPWYINAIDIPSKHSNVRHSYFWSINFDAPREVTLNFFRRRRATGNVAASASTSTSRILEMMGDDNEWDQVEGRFTVSPEDDEFERK